MVEVIVGLVLMGAVLTVTVPMLKSINQTRRINEQRRVATLELGNLMEQVATWPAARWKAEELRQLKLSANAQSQLPEADLKSTATPSAKPVGLTRVELSLAWSPVGGVRPEPVRLTAWLSGGK